MNGVYPCTIFCDRYHGSYSGGRWIAVPVHIESVLDYLGGDPNSDDGEVMNIWDRISFEKDKAVGKGPSPDEALKSLELFLTTPKPLG